MHRPLKNTARGELEAPIAIGPRQRLALVELNLHSAGVELSPDIPQALLLQLPAELRGHLLAGIGPTRVRDRQDVSSDVYSFPGLPEWI